MPTKLLVADDSVTIQKVIGLTFAGEDVEIESAANGTDALEKLRSFRADLVLADVFMPGRNGYEVCETIKKDPALSRIPVVLLVGAFEPFDTIEASRVGSDGYLTKPFDTTELVDIVRQLTKRSAVNARVEVRAKVNKMDAVLELTNSEISISARTRESFLGSGRILVLFDSGAVSPAPWQSVTEAREAEAAVLNEERVRFAVPASPRRPVRASSPSVSVSVPRNLETGVLQVIPFQAAQETGPTPGVLELTPEMVQVIVEKLVGRISQEVVRDVAWEVVPELAETLIRQQLCDRE